MVPDKWMKVSQQGSEDTNENTPQRILPPVI